MKLSEKLITKTVLLLRKFYLFLAIFFFLCLIITLLNKSPQESIGMFVIGIVGSLSFYFGLKTRQAWIVPIMKLFAFLSIIGQLLVTVDSSFLFAVKLFMLILNIFQLYFFTRKEVSKYFKAKNNFLFGV